LFALAEPARRPVLVQIDPDFDFKDLVGKKDLLSVVEWPSDED